MTNSVQNSYDDEVVTVQSKFSELDADVKLLEYSSDNICPVTLIGELHVLSM